MSGILSYKIENIQSFWKHISCMLMFTILVFNSEAQTQKQFLDAGNEAFENGDYFEAIHHFEQALKFKANEQAQYLIAMSYYELKEYEKAATHFAKAPTMENNTLSRNFIWLTAKNCWAIILHLLNIFRTLQPIIEKMIFTEKKQHKKSLLAIGP
jgi:tetratricopeptide (TPR) repeat protein